MSTAPPRPSSPPLKRPRLSSPSNSCTHSQTPNHKHYRKQLNSPHQHLPPRTSRTTADPSTPAPPPRSQRPEYELAYTFKGHKAGVSSVKFSPDGKWIASCSADKTVKIWSAVTYTYEQTIQGHTAGVNDVDWAPDSKVLASASDDKTIRLWDLQSGKQILVLIGHHNYVYSLSFSPIGNTLASGSYDEALRVWDVRTGSCLRTLPAHSDPISGVHFNPDGTMIVSCSHDGLIRVWDTATGQCLRTLVEQDENAPVTGVRFSPNGKYLLAGTKDSAFRLWDYLRGKCLKTYLGHRNERFSIFSTFVMVNEGGEGGGKGGGGWVVGGSEDSDVFLWDVGTKEVVQTLVGHEDVVLGVSAHPQGAVIASCGLDGTVRVWIDKGRKSRATKVKQEEDS